MNTAAPILVVAMGNSIHTLRWLRTVSDGSRPLVLISSNADPCLQEIERFPQVLGAADALRLAPGEIGLWPALPNADEQAPDDMPSPIGYANRAVITRGATIARAVRELRPALVHSMEVQMAGYACLRAAELLGDAFPRWLVSNWGSDFFLYEKLAAHRPLIRAIARRMDGCISECHRDLEIVRGLGYAGRSLRVLPASGGADFEQMPVPAQPPSERRDIVVKGYHGWSGRAMHIVSALHLAAPRLRGFHIHIVLGNRAIAHAARLVAETDGLDIAVEPWREDHATALARMSHARIMVGIGISDGIGTTLLEAMSLGAFPIVANTACAAEWIDSGRHGFVMDPHDVGALAEALAAAATDDALVDAAAPRNRAEVERRWNARINRTAALAAYDAVLEQAG